MDNPFIVGRPVRNPHDFYGRKNEIREIFSLIKKQQPVSLTGQRRTGRTSILHHITHPDVVTEYLNPEPYIFLYIDFEGLSELTQTQFWELILTKMKKSVKASVTTPINTLLKKEKLTTIDIYNLIEEYSNQGIRIVFCFDEFESVTQNTNFTSTFFNNLRYLVSSYSNVTYVTVSRKDLKELTHSKKTRSSPFFNIFHEMRIGFLTLEDTKHLISKSSEQGGVKFNEDDENFVLDVAYFHPFFVQVACYEIFKHRCDTGKTLGEKLDQDSYEKLRETLYGKFEKHFDYYWIKLQKKEQKTLKDLCKSPWEICHHDTTVETLRNLCLVKEHMGEYRLFSSILHRYCRERDFRPEIFRGE
jgi:hypothetical protein